MTLWKSLAEVEDYYSFLCVMMSLPFMYGFANRLWQRAINAILEKVTGSGTSTPLRIIGLVEPNYNCRLKAL